MLQVSETIALRWHGEDTVQFLVPLDIVCRSEKFGWGINSWDSTKREHVHMTGVGE